MGRVFSSLIHDSLKSLAEAKTPELREMLKKNSVVVSAPHIFFLAGEHAVLQGAPALCVPLPFRVYVGLEDLESPLRPDSKISISFGEEKILDWDKREFLTPSLTHEQSEAYEGERKNIIKVIENVINEYKLGKRRFRINVYSILPPGRGTNWSGAFSAALATALLVFNRRLKRDEVEKWSSIPVHELLREENFRLCNRIAWQIENVIHGNRASGYGTTLSLGSCLYGSPFVYYTVPRSDDPTEGMPPVTLSIENAGTWLDVLAYFACEVASLFPDEKKPKLNLSDPDFPLRILLVDTGQPKQTAVQIAKARKTEEEMKRAGEDVPKIFKKIFEDVGTKPLEQSIGRVKGVQPSSILAKLAVQAVFAFCDLLQCYIEGIGDGGHELNLEAAVNRFLGILRAYQAGLELLGLRSWQGEAIKGNVYRMLRQNWFRVAIKWTGGGGGGTIMLALAKVGDAHVLEKVIEAIKALTDGEEERKITVYWDSFYDGVEQTGVKVELDEPRQHEVFCVDYLIQGDRCEIKSKTLYKFSDAQIEEFGTLRQEGWFIDAIKQRIFYNGKYIGKTGGPSTLPNYLYVLVQLAGKHGTARIPWSEFEASLASAGQRLLKRESFRKYGKKLEKVAKKALFIIEKNDLKLCSGKICLIGKA